MTRETSSLHRGLRIAPLQELGSDTGGALANLEQFVGYRPIALATMARRQGMLEAVLELVNVVLRQSGHLPVCTRYLLACEAARQNGNQYTAAHVVHAAHCAGVDWERIVALASAMPHHAPNNAEQALLRLAGPLALVEQKDAAWQAVRGHWHDDALAEAVGTIALVAWFARWNTLVETVLETEPASALAHVPWLRHMSH